MRKLDMTLAADREILRALRSAVRVDPEVEAQAAAIVGDVRREGEAAVLRYTAQLDGAALDELELPMDQWMALADAAPAGLVRILRKAAENIRSYHQHQRGRSYRWRNCQHRVIPLDAVGVYAPGGRALYPSTVLMTAIPATVAGVREVLLATPPRRDGSIAPVVAAAARLAGVDRIFRMGGAQAVAALAYGVGSVPAVDVIAGPGNAWVAAAKRLVRGQVRVDLEAGPSEVLILADQSATPEQIARDLVAQAEHDPRAFCVLVTPSRALADAVPRAVAKVLASEPNPVAAESLSVSGAIAVTASLAMAIEVANELAPEHLEVQVGDPEPVVAALRTAGAIFVGPYTSTPMGDYLAGPNHTLPTGGTSRFASGLSVADFERHLHVVRWSEADLRRDGPDVARFARSEGLLGHARSVEARLQELPPSPEGATSRREPASYLTSSARSLPAYHVPGGEVDVAVSLDRNESPWDLPAELKQEVAARLAEASWSRYPAYDLTSLQERVAALAGWKAEGVVLGHGSNQLIDMVFRAVLGPGDRVVTVSPGFSLFGPRLRLTGADVVEVPLRGPDFAFDIDALCREASQAKMVLLASPNNPTGSVLPEGAVDRLLETDALIFLDEAYAEMSSQDFSSYLAEDRPLLINRTFSKAWAAAGVRLGALLAPTTLAAALRAMPVPYHLSWFGVLALEALLDRPDLVAERAAALTRGREALADSLRALGVHVVPSEANFLLFRCPRPSGEVFRGLLERGVRVRDISGAVPDHLRVTVGTDMENQSFLTALAEVLA